MNGDDGNDSENDDDGNDSENDGDDDGDDSENGEMMVIMMRGV